MPPPRANCCLSVMNIHGARRAGRQRRKACTGWSWAAACAVQGGVILRGFPNSLLSCVWRLVRLHALALLVFCYISQAVLSFLTVKNRIKTRLFFCNHTNNVLLLYYRTMCKFFGALVVALWTYFGALFLFLP